MTYTKGRRWCEYDRRWEFAPRCVICDKPLQLARIDVLGLRIVHVWRDRHTELGT